MFGGRVIDWMRARAPGFIHDVNRLVRQEPTRDVAVGKPRGGQQRFVRELGAVMLLVLRTQALQNLDGLVHCRRLDDDRLEPAFQRRVLLDVLAVLVHRGRADDLQLAA